MTIEVISAQIGPHDPERIPSLQGFGPIAGPPRPLVDPAGRPLLPRIARAVRNGLTLPSPASVAGERTRSALDAGAPYPALDHELLAAAQERGRRLHAQVSADLLLAAFGGVVHGTAWAFRAAFQGLGRWAARAFRPAPSLSAARRMAPYGQRGVLDVPPDYEERRALFYGRGL